MTRANNLPPTRPNKTIERKSQRFLTYITPTLEGLVLDEAAKDGVDPTQFGRDALEFYLANKNKAMRGTRSYRGKFLTKAPAGPWEEALEHAGEYTINEEIADELEARDGDVFVRAVGESMEGAAILDGALLLMSPLGNKTPRRGEVVLAEVTDAHGNCFGTIKHWIPGDPPRLQDGDENDLALPEVARNVRAVALCKGVISRY